MLEDLYYHYQLPHAVGRYGDWVKYLRTAKLSSAKGYSLLRAVLYGKTDLHFLISLITEDESFMVGRYFTQSPYLPTASGNAQASSEALKLQLQIQLKLQI